MSLQASDNSPGIVSPQHDSISGEMHNPSYQNSSFNDEVSYDKRTQMRSIKEGLESVLGKIDPTGQKTHIQTEITQAWIDVAGETVAAHTEAVFLKGSLLVVWLDSNIWVQELTLMAPLYKDRINELLGNDRVSECQFTLRDSEKKRFQKRFKTNS